MDDEQTVAPELDVPPDREPAPDKPAPVPTAETPFGIEFRRRHMRHLRPHPADPTVRVSY